MINRSARQVSGSLIDYQLFTQLMPTVPRRSTASAGISLIKY